MATSEEYLKEHNISSVSMISEGTSAPTLLIKVDGETLRAKIPQGSVSSVSDIDRIIEDNIYEYEYKKRVKERKLKLGKIVRKSD